MTLSARQRQYLKGLAHSLAPVVRIGQRGVTPAVTGETRNSLEAHELIKVRVDGDDPATRRAAIEELAQATESDIAGVVGKVAILYKARAEKPKIKLP